MTLSSILPSSEEDSVELMAARVDGPVLIQRTRRNGVDLAGAQRRGCRTGRQAAGGSGGWRGLDMRAHLAPPIVFSWLAQRGKAASRINIRDFSNARELRAALLTLLTDRELFVERIVVLNSRFRSPADARHTRRWDLPRSALSSVG